MNLAWSCQRHLFVILAEDGATDEVVGRFCLDRRRGRRSREVLRLLLLQQSRDFQPVHSVRGLSEPVHGKWPFMPMKDLCKAYWLVVPKEFLVVPQMSKAWVDMNTSGLYCEVLETRVTLQLSGLIIMPVVHNTTWLMSRTSLLCSNWKWDPWTQFSLNICETNKWLNEHSHFAETQCLWLLTLNLPEYCSTDG